MILFNLRTELAQTVAVHLREGEATVAGEATAAYALRKLRPQIEEHHIEVGYSNSRTCEIGLQSNTGIPYMSIVYLVNICTTLKK